MPETRTTTFADRSRQLFKGSTGRWIVIGLVFGVTIMSIYLTYKYWYGDDLPALDGCYDSAGNIYSLLDSYGRTVDSTGSQCKAVLSLAAAFGFPAASSCLKNTTITSPTDSNSYISAQFCDTNTVYKLTVRNPPTPLAQVPITGGLGSLVNLAGIGFHHALYGNNILEPLFNVLQTPRYFMMLNMTGDIGVTDPKRILNGSLPQLTPVLADPKGRFFGIGLSNNNLSGSIPANFGDSLGHFNVSNNPLLSGPLPQSVTNSIGQWTGTRVCRLENTQLCVPATWAHEPSCIRDTALALPVCGGTTPLSIDPSDPNAPASRGWWIFNGSFNQIVGITFLFAFIVMLMWGLVLWRRRNLAIRSREESDYTSPQRPEDIELNARRADELNLPMYEPPAPAYAEGSTAAAAAAAAAAEAKKDDQK